MQTSTSIFLSPPSLQSVFLALTPWTTLPSASCQGKAGHPSFQPHSPNPPCIATFLCPFLTTSHRAPAPACPVAIPGQPQHTITDTSSSSNAEVRAATVPPAQYQGTWLAPESALLADFLQPHLQRCRCAADTDSARALPSSKHATAAVDPAGRLTCVCSVGLKHNGHC